QPAEQVVFRVTNIVVPTLDMSSEEAKRDLDALNRGVSEDIVAEYLAHLESEIGVTINQGALNQVVGGGAGEGADCPDPCRSSRKPRHLPSATREASHRSCGPRSSRISRPRCRLSSRSRLR